MLTALLVANGTAPSRAELADAARSCDLSIAVDGGLNAYQDAGVLPDIICGDFDSVDPNATRRENWTARWILAGDQKRSDLDKALEIALQHGATNTIILGGFGGRPDHTLGNVAVLAAYAGRVRARMSTGQTHLYALEAGYGPFPFHLRTRPGDIVSLISADAQVVVSISGVQWSLRHELLERGGGGISNVAVAEEVAISLHEGTLYAWHIDNAPAV